MAVVGCGAVSEELPLVVDGARRPSAAMAAHLESCLACQAELAGYRRLLRVLRSLKEQPVSLPAGGPDVVSAALRAQLGYRQRRVVGKWLVTGAMAAAGATALGTAAIVILWARRSRPLPVTAQG